MGRHVLPDFPMGCGSSFKPASKAKQIGGIILSLVVPFDTLGRQLLINPAINLAKGANRGCQCSAPCCSWLATPRLLAVVEQHPFGVICFFFFSVSSQQQHFSPGCKSPTQQRWHHPARLPGQRGGMAQLLRFNCHLGMSGVTGDGASVYSQRGPCPPRMQPGRRRETGASQGLCCLAPDGSCSWKSGGT